MNVVKATRRFEHWLAQQTHLVAKDLRFKHANMRSAVFPFLRATFYRWAQLWPQICPDLAKAPRVLAVGDLHIENFGTWRDIEGRLVWGVNDFDEAYLLGYTNDLVRLSASAHLASAAGHLPLKKKDICDAVLEGYLEGMNEGGPPFVLGEQNDWLRQIAESDLRNPVRFWRKMDSLPTVTRNVPAAAIEAMEHLMPAQNLRYRLARRVAGLGSLGHQRFAAIADWNGGKIAREAKALALSSCAWAEDRHRSSEVFYEAIVTRAVRCPDPFVQVRGRWIVRRLSPHCSRIELESLRAAGSELRLLHAMGRETANIHLGSTSARRHILRHIRNQKRKWLHEATQAMVRLVVADWKMWKKQGYE